MYQCTMTDASAMAAALETPGLVPGIKKMGDSVNFKALFDMTPQQTKKYEADLQAAMTAACKPYFTDVAVKPNDTVDRRSIYYRF
jgi:hypothetical protein